MKACKILGQIRSRIAHCCHSYTLPSGSPIPTERRARGSSAGTPGAKTYQIGLDHRVTPPSILEGTSGTVVYLWLPRPIYERGLPPWLRFRQTFHWSRVGWGQAPERGFVIGGKGEGRACAATPLAQARWFVWRCLRGRRFLGLRLVNGDSSEG